MKRIVKYRRVSTKEQSIKGFSLEAQNEVLDNYIKLHNLNCVGDYMDDGYSASSSKRPGLTQLLEDIKEGKIDLVIFTKLDRWFRSVSQYYKIQDILEQNGTAWRTVLEDYNTETSDGKFKVNIMLSVAQNEIDRTSERIKVVFDHKLAKLQPITGAQPFGYMISNGKIIKDPKTQHIVEDIFDTFEREQSYKETLRQINKQYGIEIRYSHLMKIIMNRKYTGEFRNIPDYYPPYLSVARFETLRITAKKNIKDTPSKTTYIFAKLLRCGTCGLTITGCHCINSYGKEYSYYRCSNSYLNERCTAKRRVSEIKFEKALLNSINDKIQDYLIEVQKIADDTPNLSITREELKNELDRLNVMFRKGRISEEMYDHEYNQIEMKLNSIPKSQNINENLERFLHSDFKTFYNDLPPEDKRLIWRSIIDKIVVRSNTDFDIIFL